VANKTAGRILLVEDDGAIAAGLRMNLRHEGYEVHVAHDGEDGLRQALSLHPDVVVLDVMLPSMNGYEVLRAMRQRGVACGVLMLTAKGLEEDKILGLNLGADDYVAKPFSLPELLARVRALMRRFCPDDDVVVVGMVTVDRRARSATRNGLLLSLSPREMALLLYFLDHPRRALSRETILEGAWGLDYEGTTRTIDNFVVSLRQHIEVDPTDPKHLQTVRGIGYRFEPGIKDPVTR
jgi:two-component system, OmpR family, alkaline phosphatase synthesis response regulator PhoP